MKKLKKLLSYIFLIFLVVYFLVMLGHIFKLTLNLSTIVFFLAGLSLAIFAHARKNYITIILLVAHMSIEWFEWSQIGFSATGGTTWNIIHILMDFVFLYHELSVHIRKYKNRLTGLALLTLVGIFYFSSHFLSESQVMSDVVELVEPFVIAGILGCVGSHLFHHLRHLKIGLNEEYRHWH